MESGGREFMDSARASERKRSERAVRRPSQVEAGSALEILKRDCQVFGCEEAAAAGEREGKEVEGRWVLKSKEWEGARESFDLRK